MPAPTQRCRLWLLLLVAQWIPVSLAAQALPPRLVATIDSLLEAQQSVDRIPGLAVVVARLGGPILYSANHGVADLGSGERVSARTAFRIFSISKVYAAAVAHQLADEGRLRFGDPIGRYLPGLPAWRDSVTVRDLLAHTSGIEDYTDLPGWRSGASDHLAFADVALQQPLHFPPGSAQRYSNTNFVLVQQIIEGLSGRPLMPLLRSQVLEPSALLATTANCSAPQVATGHLFPRDSTAAVLPVTPLHQHPVAVGGLCATASDVTRFFQRLLTGHVVNGTSAAFAFPRDSLVLVALANIGGAGLSQLLRALRRTVFGVPEPVVLDLPFPGERVQPLLGRYPDLNGPGRLILSERNGRLHGMGQRLLYQGNDVFVPESSRDVRLDLVTQNGVVTDVGLETYGRVESRFRRAQ